MSLDYVELELGGRQRKLRYRIADVRDLGTRLTGASFGVILQRLAELDINALFIALFVGLRNDDPRLKPADVEGFVQRHVDEGGTVDDLAAAAVRALSKAGVMARRAEPGEEDAADPSGATSKDG